MHIPHNIIAGTRTAADTKTTARFTAPGVGETAGETAIPGACARRPLMLRDCNTLSSKQPVRCPLGGDSELRCYTLVQSNRQLHS